MTLDRFFFKCSIIAILPLCLSSCAGYTAKPLPETSTLAMDAAAIEKDGVLRSKGVDLSDGIDSNEIVILALQRNPDLKLAQDDELIAERSMAGNSPESQISLGYGDIVGQKIGTYDAGVGFDIASLLSMPSRYRMENEEQHKATLSRIWQEWQIAQQARILFVQSYYQKKIVDTLTETADLMNRKIEHLDEALGAGNVAISGVAVELAARSDVRSKLNDSEKLQLQTQSALADLVGFSPEFNFDLQGELKVEAHADKDVEELLVSLPRRRPDLAALNASYRLEEEKVYQAVLAQFPRVTIGFNRTRDSANITESVFGISLNIPIFYRSKGAVHLEEAIRQRQWDEYQGRLNATTSELKRLLIERKLLTGQINSHKTGLPRLEAVSNQASSALSSGNIDALTFSDLRMAYLNSKLELFGLEEQLIEREVAIETLIGSELPPQNN